VHTAVFISLMTLHTFCSSYRVAGPSRLILVMLLVPWLLGCPVGEPSHEATPESESGEVRPAAGSAGPQVFSSLPDLHAIPDGFPPLQLIEEPAPGLEFIQEAATLGYGEAWNRRLMLKANVGIQRAAEWADEAAWTSGSIEALAPMLFTWPLETGSPRKPLHFVGLPAELTQTATASNQPCLSGTILTPGELNLQIAFQQSPGSPWEAAAQTVKVRRRWLSSVSRPSAPSTGAPESSSEEVRQQYTLRDRLESPESHEWARAGALHTAIRMLLIDAVRDSGQVQGDWEVAQQHAGLMHWNASLVTDESWHLKVGFDGSQSYRLQTKLPDGSLFDEVLWFITVQPGSFTSRQVPHAELRASGLTPAYTDMVRLRAVAGASARLPFGVETP